MARGRGESIAFSHGIIEIGDLIKCESILLLIGIGRQISSLNMPLSRKGNDETIKRALWGIIPLAITIFVLVAVVWPLWLDHTFYQRLLAQAKGPEDLSRPRLYLYHASSYVHKASGSLISFNLQSQCAGVVPCFDF
jgi:hypothetical protein